MKCFSSWVGTTRIAYQIKRSGLLSRSWHLRWNPVCISTEVELSKWLRTKPFLKGEPRVCLTAKQTHGRGQRGRTWSSPPGGVWLSAAIPFESPNQSAGLFGLAVAVALANTLEKNLIPARIKWPNDLLVHNRKIAGFLPRIVYRGQDPTLLCIGVGLNVSNRVPFEGISISEVSSNHGDSSVTKWSLEVLLAIEKAIILIQNPRSVCLEGERLLWAKQIKKINSNEIWDIDGLDLKGQLKVNRGLKKEKWSRWE